MTVFLRLCFSKVLFTISFVEGLFNFFTLWFKYFLTIFPIIFVELSLVVKVRSGRLFQ